MAAHAVAYFKNPSNDTQKKVGYYTAVYLQIRNDGNEGGNFYFGIKKNGVGCTSLYNFWLEPNAAKNVPACKFTMPNSRVTINYFGGHAENAQWQEDFSDTIYIDPEEPVTTYCSQTVKTVDSTGKALSGARVHLWNGTISYLSTDSSGYGTFTRLSEGRTHYVQAEKSGYSISGTKSFKACTGIITLILGATCNCEDWVQRECVREGVRRYTRKCTPSGCLPDERTVSDPTCITAEPPEEPPEEEPPMPPGGPYEKWNCTTIREFQATSDIHITEVECFCPDGTRARTQIQNHNWSWIETMMSKYCAEKVPKGEITYCNINTQPCPNCGTAGIGKEIVVVAEMKNVGKAMGKFKFYIYDQDGKILSKEPDVFEYKDVNPGATWRVTKTWTTNLNFEMLNKALNGELNLARQT